METLRMLFGGLEMETKILGEEIYRRYRWESQIVLGVIRLE